MFVSDQEYPDVWLLELETKRLTRLTHSAQRERFPVIGPDGRSVAYLATKGMTSHLYWLPVGNGKPIDFGAGDDILFSPDAAFGRGIPGVGKILPIRGNERFQYASISIQRCRYLSGRQLICDG